MSARGDRAVLTSFGPGSTRLTVVGSSRWTVFRRIDLRGTYGVEAVSLDGRRLFLIKYDDGGYNLRVYDLRTSRLSVTPLVEGPSAQQKMIGAAWTSVATSDGRRLLTLYVKPDGGGFLHSLDLDRGFGHCLDLPAGFVDPSTIRTSSLALSPDERRLYVAGPFAGRLLVVDLAGPRIARIVRFRNGRADARHARPRRRCCGLSERGRRRVRCRRKGVALPAGQRRRRTSRSASGVSPGSASRRTDGGSSSSAAARRRSSCASGSSSRAAVRARRVLRLSRARAPLASEAASARRRARRARPTRRARRC